MYPLCCSAGNLTRFGSAAKTRRCTRGAFPLIVKRTIADNQTELGLTSSQSLALFGKIVRRLTKHVQDIQKSSIGSDIPLHQPAISTLIKGPEASSNFKATDQTIEQDLAEPEAVERLQAAEKDVLKGLDMAEFAIDGSADFSSAEAQIKALANATPAEKARLSSTISLKSGPAVEVEKPKKADKVKRRESGGDAKRNKKPKKA
jgi:N-acetyltransferase 10